MVWHWWYIPVALVACVLLALGALAFMAHYMSDRPGGGQW